MKKTKDIEPKETSTVKDEDIVLTKEELEAKEKHLKEIRVLFDKISKLNEEFDNKYPNIQKMRDAERRKKYGYREEDLKKSEDKDNGNEDLRLVKDAMKDKELPKDIRKYLLDKDETVDNKINFLVNDALERLVLVKASLDNDDWGVEEVDINLLFGIKRMVDEGYDLLEVCSNLF